MNRFLRTVTKPDVVFFGENAPEYQTMYSLLHPKRVKEKDILLVIGSSLQVVGVQHLMRFDSYHPRRKNDILLNKEETGFERHFEHVLLGSAVEKIDKSIEIIETVLKN